MELVFFGAALVTVVTGLVAFYRWIRKVIKEKQKISESKIDLSCIGQRFISLFESHGVNKAQIPAFFDHGLSINQCSSPQILKEHLTSEMINDACKLFNVNLDWLYGASEEIYEVLDFYKNPKKFELFIENLIESANGELVGYAIKASDNTNYDGYDAVILYIETIGEINDRPVYRYYFCGKWSIKYWKSRCYFVACCAISLRKEVYLHGRTAPQVWIQGLTDGKTLMEYDYTYFKGEPKIPNSYFWSVDEFIERPITFLQGVDKEINNYGTRAALAKWLDLDNDGFMKVWNDGSHESVVESFRSHLTEIGKK